MTNLYDVIIIGAGHNGLTEPPAYLAKAKKRVLVLERRTLVGGSVVTETFGEGFQADSVWTGGMLRPDIIKDLSLASYGLRADTVKQPFASLLDGSETLVLDPDPVKAAESIKRFSEKDAARWPEFVAFMDRAAHFLDTAYSTIMPRLPKDISFSEGYGLAEIGLDLRLMGSKDMLNLIRLIPMTVIELVEEWFESEQLKAAVASLAIHGFTLGPMSGGTGYTLMHNWLNRGGLSHSNVGRAGEITQALAGAVKAYGGEIRTDAEVAGIHIDTYTSKGVKLTSGEEIFTETVISAVDPKRTFLSLVGAVNLPPEFVWHTQFIKIRGSVAKIHLLTDGDHGIPEGTFVVAPTLRYLERAYDAAKYGGISEKPYLEVTTSWTVISIHFQFAPYSLKSGTQHVAPGTWNLKRETLENLAINILSNHFPNLKSKIINRKSLTPLDLESVYGLTEGDLNHGQLMLDQFLFMRPMPGWSNHKTPIDGLYLAGSGVHGGGGVSGVSGRNAAKVLLGSLKK